jgi:streptogramin lyase
MYRSVAIADRGRNHTSTRPIHFPLPTGVAMLPVRMSAFALLLGLVYTSTLTAQPDAKKEAPKPDYPRVNLAPIYEVDPAWPQRPSGVSWDHVPGVAVDAKDNVWIFTRTTPPVQVYTADGKFVKSWGSDTVGKAHHIRIARDGNLWCADTGHHIVRKYDPDGKILATFGMPDEWGVDERRMNKPTDVAEAPNGDVFISDGYGNNRIVHFDKDGKFVKAWGKLGNGPEDFSLPHSIVMDSKGRLYIADRNNCRIQVYDQSGKLLDSWANVMVPWGLWISPQDEIWACGSTPSAWKVDPKYPTAPLNCPPKDQVIMKFDTTGRVRQVWSLPKGEDDKEKPGEVNWLHMIAFDSKGNFYAGDVIGKRVQKFVVQK